MPSFPSDAPRSHAVWAKSVAAGVALEVLRWRTREIDVAGDDALTPGARGEDRALQSGSPIDRLHWLLGELPR